MERTEGHYNKFVKKVSGELEKYWQMPSASNGDYFEYDNIDIHNKNISERLFKQIYVLKLYLVSIFIMSHNYLTI